MSFMGLSQLDSSRSAKVGGPSKFTSRRDYQEAMAPRATSEETSDSDDANQTVHRSCVFEEQANRIMASLIADQKMARSTSLMEIQSHQAMSRHHTTKRRSSAKCLEVICPHVWSAYHSQISALKPPSQTLQQGLKVICPPLWSAYHGQTNNLSL